jgi:hypothetical protein
VFTARYALSPYIKQIRFVFKGLMKLTISSVTDSGLPQSQHYHDLKWGLHCHTVPERLLGSGNPNVPQACYLSQGKAERSNL